MFKTKKKADRLFRSAEENVAKKAELRDILWFQIFKKIAKYSLVLALISCGKRQLLVVQLNFAKYGWAKL